MKHSVYQALYESEVTNGDVIGGRKLLVVARSWTQAASKAVDDTKDGETLVSLSLAKDTVI